MARDPIPLAGRVVAITGAARGIGRATAAELISRGARVAIGDLEEDLAAKTAEELGGSAISGPLDVTDRASFEGFLDEAERQLGPVDVLINNAGIMPIRRLIQEDDATARRIIDVNVHGVIVGSKLALERMVPRNRGHIVNISSMAGKSGYPGLGTYCASKHAVVGLCEALYWEVEGTGVEISTVMPAIVRTELSGGMKESRLVKSVEPDDVARAIADALEQPRPQVFVPKSGEWVLRITGILPAVVQKAIFRAAGGTQIAAEAEAGARAAYEARAAGSAPASDAAASEGQARTEAEHAPS